MHDGAEILPLNACFSQCDRKGQGCGSRCGAQQCASLWKASISILTPGFVRFMKRKRPKRRRKLSCNTAGPKQHVSASRVFLGHTQIFAATLTFARATLGPFFLGTAHIMQSFLLLPQASMRFRHLKRRQTQLRSIQHVCNDKKNKVA